MSPRNAANALYHALNTRDGEALLSSMTDDFVGTVSAGMPYGVGGKHWGPEAMLREVWIPVFQNLDVTLDVDHVFEAGEDACVAVGTYRGSERASGEGFGARFAHVLETRRGRVSRLEQITDTGSWPGGDRTPGLSTGADQ